MKFIPYAGFGLAATFALAFAVQGQDKPGSGAHVGVLNLRDCMDKTRNVWIADIDLEMAKMQEADSGRATDLNPQERARIRAKILDASNRKRLEVYTEIVRLSGVLARERGYELIQRIDRMPVLEPGETDLAAQIDHRYIFHFDPSVDLTQVILERLNRDYTARKK